MDIHSWPLTVMLISLRLGAAMMLTPVVGVPGMPVPARMLLTLMLAGSLACMFPDVSGQKLSGIGDLLQAALQEVALGTLLGLSVALAFAATSMAGALLDVQIGYGIAQVFDPLTRRHSPVLTSMFGLTGAMVFFLVNGHHALLRGLAFGLDRIPPGRAWNVGEMAGPLLKQAAGMFGLGFSLAAPVAFCILLSEAGLGVIARNLPQMNMFAVGLPAKVVIGLGALSLWMSGAGEVMGRIYHAIFMTWEAMLEGAF